MRPFCKPSVAMCVHHSNRVVITLTLNPSIRLERQAFGMVDLWISLPVLLKQLEKLNSWREWQPTDADYGPVAWNSLLSDIRTASTLFAFKNRLKTHMFLQSYYVLSS